MYSNNKTFDDLPEPFRTYAKENSNIPEVKTSNRDMLFFILLILIFYD